MKNNKKLKNEQPSTLDYTLVLQIMSSHLSSIFWSGPIAFPFAMKPCKLNHNLICLCPGPLSKDLETNLNLLTNKNARFHWTLFLEPLSKSGPSSNFLTLQIPLKEEIVGESKPKDRVKERVTLWMTLMW
jgi:hypothetical protein